MLYLSKSKLAQLAAKRGLSLAALAKAAGISRQSLYNMFDTTPVWNTSFAKLLRATGSAYDELVEARHSFTHHPLMDAPPPIRRAAFTLTDFCRTHHAALVLFGSRARGKRGLGVDWDFGVLFRHMTARRTTALRTLATELKENAFPFRIDIVNLNHAPPWFRDTVDREHHVLYGSYA